MVVSLRDDPSYAAAERLLYELRAQRDDIHRQIDAAYGRLAEEQHGRQLTVTEAAAFRLLGDELPDGSVTQRRLSELTRERTVVGLALTIQERRVAELAY